MFFFLQRHVGRDRPWQRRSSIPRSGGSLGFSLILNGALCVLFGLAIIAAPELLAFIVATFLIFAGVMLIAMGWKMRR